MTADDAFDNLASRHELVIPVAGDAGEHVPAADAVRPVNPAGAAMRVDSLLDDGPGDYYPHRDIDAGTGLSGEVHNHPTETDLDPVAPGTDTEEVASAHSHGARIVGRDTDTTLPGYDDDADYREANEVDEDDSLLGLSRARRVSRFSYIPLERMEDFEAGARDLAAKFASADRERPSLAITSSVRGEGRTELAIRMALALAKKVGSRVLLADFDVRKPGVAARLGISSKYFTVADVLRGTCRLGDALIASEEDNLYVLPARANDREGDEILDSRQIESALADMHRAFDYTILDCAPAIHADAMIVCRLAGAVALAGMCRFSYAGRMNQAASRLREAGARVAGMLLTEA